MSLEYRKIIPVALISIVFLYCTSVSTASEKTEAHSSFHQIFPLKQLSTLFPSSKKEIWSCYVEEIKTGNVLFQKYPHLTLIPASNQKLLIGAASLLHLGEDYKNNTIYAADGPIQKGSISGNLIIIGYGGIHFTSRFFSDSIPEKVSLLNDSLNALARNFHQMSINEIQGNIIVDSSSWTDMKENKHYPSAFSVSFHENTVDVTVKKGDIFTCPQEHIGFQFLLSHQGVSQHRTESNQGEINTIVINTQQDSSDYWRLEGYSPSHYYEYHIQRALEKRDIRVLKKPFPVQKEHRKVLFTLPSIPLGVLIKDMGIHSDNFRAETLFLHLGYLLKGKANYPNASFAVQHILNKNELLFPELLVSDGSGLSRNNRISSKNIVQLLDKMLMTSHRQAFLRMFPTSGGTGTLKQRLRKFPGRILAKTGTLRDVIALSGYVMDNASPVLSFSFLGNQISNKERSWKSLEEACRILVSFVDGQ